MIAHILFEVWAGAIGVPVVRKQLDAAKLTAEKQAELQKLLSTSGVFHIPDVTPAPQLMRDGTHTKIVLEMDGETKVVRIPDEEITPQLRGLIEFLKANGS